MAYLETGRYEEERTKDVYVWPSPDKDGDGDEVLEEIRDGDGNVLGHDIVKDQNGQTKRHYNPPKGFRNVPNYDRQDNYVLHDEKGRIVRHPRTGEAYVIRPGEALVVHPNGDQETLAGEYAHKLFADRHSKVGADATPTAEDGKENPA